MRQITIVNLSSVVSPQELAVAVAAVQYQLVNHVAPAWDRAAPRLVIGQDVGQGERLYVLDDTPQADVLGFHELETVDPIGFVFARTDMRYGMAWTSTLSHEASEQFINPWCDLGRWVVYRFLPAFMDVEISDPVENDEYVLSSNPSRLSNFVLPAWYRTDAPAGTKFDFLGKLRSPLTFSPGGYFAYSTDLRNWQQKQGERIPAHQIYGGTYTRRWRRVQQRAKFLGTSTGDSSMAITVPQNILDELIAAGQAGQDAVAADGVAASSAAAATTAANKAGADQDAAHVAHQTATAKSQTAIADVTAWLDSEGMTPPSSPATAALKKAA